MMKLNQGSQSMHRKGPGGQCKGSSEPGGDGQTGNAWCPRIPGIHVEPKSELANFQKRKFRFYVMSSMFHIDN